MLDVITRALKHPFDYLPVVNRRTLILQENIEESPEIYSFLFTHPQPFCWKAGQHGIFRFKNKKMEGRSWRAFSIASSPDEGVVRISTIIKETPSDFKKHLKMMRKGDTLIMHGPFGEFHTSPSMTHIVGIAGGIGITPFRALIKDVALSVREHTKLSLIYSAVGSYTFKEEFDALLPCPALEILYTATPDEVNAQLQKQITKIGNGASYFISGSPRMVQAIRKTLKGAGIKHIVNDSFRGY